MRVTLIEDNKFEWASLQRMFADRHIDLALIGDVDTAYKDLVERRAPCSYLICDVQMRPGTLFSIYETSGGTTTGIELIRYLRSKRKSLVDVPTLVWSIVAEQRMLDDLSEMGISFLSKATTSKRDLVAYVARALGQ